MDIHQLDVKSRLQFFAEMALYYSKCYIWTFDASGVLMPTNSPEIALNTIFQHSSCYRYMIQHALSSSAPVLLSNRYGVMWGAVFEQENGKNSHIYVIGPAFTQANSASEVKRFAWDKVNPRWLQHFNQMINHIPVVNSMEFMKQILMMHFCVTGEHLQIGDIALQQEVQPKRDPQASSNGVYADRTQVYSLERSLLGYIRNGDANYQQALNNHSQYLTGKQRFSDNALQHAKLGQAQFTVLCAYAAMEGGVSAETAYNKKDAYIHSIDNAESISQLMESGKIMFEDYVQLVRKQRDNPLLSKAVQGTCDYIECHLGDDLSVGGLAARTGYSSYYFARLFRKEIGFSLDEYIRNARIERAKILLSSSTESIQSISDSLGFGSRNYFATVFKKVTGIPPGEYRKKHSNIV